MPLEPEAPEIAQPRFRGPGPARMLPCQDEQLMAEPNYHSLIGQLDMVLIEHAKVTIRDVKTGLTWTAPAARAPKTTCMPSG